MSTFKIIPILIVFVSLILGITKGQGPVPVAPGLSYTFYSSSCPGLDFIIRNHLWQVFQSDITQAAGLLRLHFHDCFVQGCDGSVLLEGTPNNPSEQDAPPNLTLRPQALQIINDLRALVHQQCGPIVSCADILTLAARESVFLPGGPFYFIPLGRRDSLNFATINQTLANLPPPFFNTTQLLNSFATKNLNATDLVALSGGHTYGIAHCPAFTARLYPTQDPTMDPSFANDLQLVCPNPSTDNFTNLDVQTPNFFDNKYYVNLVNREGLLFSDQDLYTDSRTRDIVTSFANSQSLFFQKFVVGMLKMGQLDVLTDSQGEIRNDCSLTNANNNNNDLDVLYTKVDGDQVQGRVSKY